MPPSGAPIDALITLTAGVCAAAMLIASASTFVAPEHPKTRYSYRFTSGATPGPTFQLWLVIVLASYGPWYVVPSESTPKPPSVPAVWVPCPPPRFAAQSSGFGSGTGVLLSVGWVPG